MSRVVVVGTSQLWLRGLSGLFEEGGLDVGTATRLSEFSGGADAGCLVLALTDAHAHFELRVFRDEFRQVPVVGVVSSVDLVTVARAMRAGATAVISEDETTEIAVDVVRQAIERRTVLPTKLVASMAQHVPDSDDARNWLSDVETAWLQAMAAGSTVGAIADDIGYSERAMFRQLRKLYLRLGVANRTEALLWAKQHGLLESTRD